MAEGISDQLWSSQMEQQEDSILTCINQNTHYVEPENNDNKRDCITNANAYNTSDIGFKLVEKNPNKRARQETPEQGNKTNTMQTEIQCQDMATEIYKITIRGISRNIAKLNQMALKKYLLTIDPGLPENTKLFTDQLLVTTTNKAIMTRLLETIDILGVEVKCTAGTLNSSDKSNKIIIFGVPFDIDQADICSETGATFASRLVKKPEGLDQPESTPVVLSYNCEPPERVFIGLRSYKGQVFIPRALRCYKCQRFGHTAKVCKGSTRCARCAGNHEIKECRVPPFSGNNSNEGHKCINCGNSHSSAFRGCPVFITAQKANEIRATERISYAEALKKAKVTKETITQKTAPAGRLEEIGEIRVEQMGQHNALNNCHTLGEEKIQTSTPARKYAPSVIETNMATSSVQKTTSLGQPELEIELQDMITNFVKSIVLFVLQSNLRESTELRTFMSNFVRSIGVLPMTAGCYEMQK